MPLTILITGGREVTRTDKIRAMVAALPPDCVVVVGGARGADAIAEQAARERGLTVKVFPVSDEEWKLYKGRAGMRRNSKMLAEGKPDLCLAFWQGEIGNGTADMARKCSAASVPTMIFEA